MSPLSHLQIGPTMQAELLILEQNDWVPNNPALPVVIYRSVDEGDCETLASAFEARFDRHDWPPRWRDKIFDYHHYHSTAHEALGVAAGQATLMLGGPGGRIVDVSAGDALVLPVGTGHRQIKASDDFLVVGAYPSGQEWDICRTAPSHEAIDRMHRLPTPAQDPIEGSGGLLVRIWSER